MLRVLTEPISPATVLFFQNLIPPYSKFYVVKFKTFFQNPSKLLSNHVHIQFFPKNFKKKNNGFDEVWVSVITFDKKNMNMFVGFYQRRIIIKWACPKNAMLFTCTYV